MDIEGRKIALLLEAMPRAKRVGFMDTVAAYEPLGHRPVVEAAASRLAVTLVPVIVDGPFDAGVFRAAFDELGRRGAQMLVLANSTSVNDNVRVIAPLAIAAGLPWPRLLRDRRAL